MKSSIKVLAIIALFFSLIISAEAQENRKKRDRKSRDPEKRALRQTTRMVEKLKLDEEQTSQVKQINLTYAKKVKEARKVNDGNREAMKKSRSIIRTEKKAAFKAILTEAQFATLEEMQEKRGKRSGEKRGNRNGRRSRK